MQILIGGDLVPTESNCEYFKDSQTDKLVDSELKSLLDSADFRIFNLEVPLTDTLSPLPKSGPNLIAPVATVSGIKALGANLLGLSNNHILDQGESGLSETMHALTDAGISFTGAGADISDAQKPFILEKNGKKIGIYACCEKEFTVASSSKSGAAPFEEAVSFEIVRSLKQSCNFVIVLYHGGKEFYRYPSPDLQKNCRALVKNGADFVICQHSHCVGCKEVFEGKTIVYGQGNFLFDRGNDEFWKSGILAELNFSENDFSNADIKFHPLKKTDCSVKLASGKDAQKIMDGFETRSKEILSDGFVEKKYAEFAGGFYKHYMTLLGGKRSKSFFMRAINKLTKNYFLKKNYGTQELLDIKNILQCQAHRELFLQALENELNCK